MLEERSFITMDQQGKMTSKLPLFNGEDYAFWNVRMRSHLMYIWLSDWLSVETGYTYPKSPPMDLEGIKRFGCNAKVVNEILVGSKERFSPK